MSENKSKTVEEKIKDLEQLISWFDSDDFVIEKSIDNYTKAKDLAADIYKDIDRIKNEVTVINKP